MAGRPLDRLRRPEYTGERRCWPCTLLNLVLVGGLAGAVGVRWLPVGLGVAAVGLALLALRGYVVPYTPQIAPWLTDRLPFAIGPEPAARPEALLAVDDPDRLLGTLLEAGILLENGELRLDSAVEAEWGERMARLRGADDGDVAAAVAAAAPFEATGDVSGSRLLVAGEGRRDVWLTRPVAIATAAGIETLVAHGLDRRVAAAAIDPLRLFLRRCPDCGEPTEESTVHNCCGGTKGVYDHPEREVLACRSCAAVLYEFPLAGDGESAEES